MGGAIRFLPTEMESGKLNRKAMQFWNSRASLKYFSIAEKLAKQVAPRAKSYLDVGGGNSKFLERFQGKKFVADIDKDGNIYPKGSGVVYKITKGTLKDFADNSIDVVFALQVLEHGSLDPNELFRVAKQAVIISYPYKWKQGSSSHKCLDEQWLMELVKRNPTHTEIAHDSKKRSVVCYLPPWGIINLVEPELEIPEQKVCVEAELLSQNTDDVEELLNEQPAEGVDQPVTVEELESMEAYHEASDNSQQPEASLDDSDKDLET